MLKKILDLIIKHKIITSVIIFILVGGSVWAYKAAHSSIQETRYVLGSVEKGTIIVTVSGTGQVSAANQLDIKPIVSGKITSLPVVVGQEVKSGVLIAKIDSSDAYKSVRDAESALESAKLSLEKLQQAADPLSLLQAENSIISAKESKANAEENLAKAYEDGFNAVADAFLDLPTIISALYEILYGSNINSNQWNVDYYANSLNLNQAAIYTYQESAESSYELARRQYDQNFIDYKATSRFSDSETIEKLIDETYITSKNIAEAIKNANNFIQFYIDKTKENNLQPVAQSTAHLSTLNGYTGTINNFVSNLLSIKNTIQNSRASITSSERTIAEKEGSLENLKAGADPLDIKTQELSIKQKEIALTDAWGKLADYTIRATFDGIIASVDVKKGDIASSGSALATLITKQRIAEISLNEVDVAQVKVGQKATLTFDAAEDLTITGEVVEVDTLGTVSSGVVSYDVKINFDTQDERIKPGMSVSAAIITQTHQDVLAVPSSAVKSNNDINYVLKLSEQYTDTTAQGVNSAEKPSQVQVEIGLSDDTNIEITSGLTEGDIIVVKTITSSSSSSSSSSINKSSNSSGSIFGGNDGPPNGAMMIR
ncbi:efflux RND transporter periplasmic adaptor subunit [Candidatus Falkowbacteria bacterium]|nr:efflux RND transporter periplasmic adaptor subunit [Candidatus Falkowbacteria bacterium]